MIQSADRTPDSPALPCRRRSVLSPDPSDQKALEFAFADYRWRVLSADPQQWTVAEKQRTLAVAFLHYHAAKLALTCEEAEPASPQGA